MNERTIGGVALVVARGAYAARINANGTDKCFLTQTASRSDNGADGAIAPLLMPKLNEASPIATRHDKANKHGPSRSRCILGGKMKWPTHCIVLMARIIN